MLCAEIIAVCSVIVGHTLHTLCGQNTHFPMLMYMVSRCTAVLQG